MLQKLILGTLLATGFATAAPAPQKKADVWQPEQGVKWQIDISDTISVSSASAPEPSDAEVWDLDLFNTDADTITNLKSAGKKVICYFSAGTSEEGRPDLGSFQDGDLGAGLPDWPGENWLDLRSESVFAVMQGRIDLAAQKGCDAIDPDNMDGYSNENGGGFNPPLSTDDSVAFLQKMADAAGSYGMSIGLKNAGDIVDSVTDIVQFAVNEQCSELQECGIYDNFTGAGKPVFHIEYGSPDQADQFCDHEGPFSTVIKEMSLNGWVHYCDGSESNTPSESKASK